MPLSTQVLHWLQALDDELLYRSNEPVGDAVEEVSGNLYARAMPHTDWEARVRAVSRENATLREEDA